MSHQNLKRIQKELLNNVSIVVKNKATKVYQLEKEIDKLIEKGGKTEDIEYEIKKLKKYNYDTYIK